MTRPLNLIFAGTPKFASVALDALLASSHQVLAVYTQPDKPAGRGLKLTQSPVKERALEKNIPIFQPSSLRSPETQAQLASFKADAMIVAAYGLILPKAVLETFPLGCINIHPSLLPRWRGAAPIPRTIFAGDKISGVTIMQMDEGLDTGPMYYQENYTLAEQETAQTLHDKLAAQGAKALIHTLDLLSENRIQAVPQDNRLATYAHKMTKEEAQIDWQKPAATLECEVRAFNPWPVSYTIFQGQPLRIWMAKARSERHHAQPGTLLNASEAGLDIATGDGILRLLTLQSPGAKVISAADFYHAKQAMLTIGQPL